MSFVLNFCYCSGLVPVIKYVNSKGFKLGLVRIREMVAK
jgi:hypothetical protein